MNIADGENHKINKLEKKVDNLENKIDEIGILLRNPQVPLRNQGQLPKPLREKLATVKAPIIEISSSYKKDREYRNRQCKPGECCKHYYE